MELDILKSKELGMFRIEVTSCGNCPFKHKAMKGQHYCNHSTMQVKYPYRDKRRLTDISVIWAECPILYCD